MRNDARPIGEDSPASPVGGDENRRDSVSHDRQSPIANQEADQELPDQELPDPDMADPRIERRRKRQTQG